MIKERVVDLLYGPPASGKSTIAQKASEELGKKYLSVGEITRREIAENTPLGLALRECLDKVIEYPVELITRAVEPEISAYIEEGSDILLDGYPKYPREAREFVALLSRHPLKLHTVAVIDLPLENVLMRVANRRICADCLQQATVQPESDSVCDCGGQLIIREDDTPKIVTRRYGDYESSVRDVLKELEGCFGQVVRINGLNEKNVVIEQVIACLSQPG